MKNWRLLFMLFLAVGLFTACGDDEPEDATRPAVEASTTDLRLYTADEFELAVTATDNEGIDTITVTSADLGSGAAAVGDTTFNGVFTFTVPETAATGNYTITVTAIDNAGNEASQDVAVSVLNTDGLVVLNVTVPENTPDDAQVEVVGSFNEWPGELDATNVLETSIVEGEVRIAKEFEDGTEFKFRRDGSWDKVEKDAAGEEISNRVYNAADGAVINATVEKWADL